MTSFHFICDNRAQMDALKYCGVNNVSISYKFAKKNIGEISSNFENVILNPGSGKRGFDSTEYNDFIKSKQDLIRFALQFDEPGDIRLTMSYYHQALEQKTPVVPILHEDYKVNLGYIKPILQGNIIALGKGLTPDGEDKDYDDIAGEYQIHGLAKARWLRLKTPPMSIDSTTWLNPVKNGKLHVIEKEGEGREISIRDTKAIARALEDNKDYIQRCNVTMYGLAIKDTNMLMRASIALHYMPYLKSLDMFEENFKA